MTTPPPEALFQPITVEIADIALHRRIRLHWWIALLFSGAFVVVFAVAVGWTLALGIGAWGANIPVNWGLDIVNTLWWIGIAHAGTMISALLLLLGQSWRTAVHRLAEIMTVLAALMASLFPVLHLGRPHLAYWMLPLPSTLGVWPQFRSPLSWDVFAFATYLLVSLTFFYLGMIPDFATLRDRASRDRQRRLYRFLALGWRGSAIHWARWRQAYMSVAIVLLLLVLSHAGGALLFSASHLPGWHTTMLAPLFVAGAAFSGFAFVVVLANLLRAGFGLSRLITLDHFDILGRLLLAAGLVAFYGYAFEIFHAWLSGGRELATVRDRFFGPSAWSGWGSLALTFFVIQALWWRRCRRSPPVLAAVAVAVMAGMWMERYMIQVGALERDFLPSSWGRYVPSLTEWGLFVGSLGLFALLFALLARLVPLVSIFEIKETVAERGRRP